MTKKKNGVSVRPSDFTAVPQPLNTRDSKALNKIGLMSIDDVEASFFAPPNDDAYFNFRSPPLAWSSAAKLFSPPHLFLHSLCTMSSDTELELYCQSRAGIDNLINNESTVKPVRDMLLAWLSRPPEFKVTMLALDKGRKVQWNAWDKTIQRAFVGRSNVSYGIPAVSMWFVYSTKSMSTSSRGVTLLGDLQENLVAEWGRWLKKVNKEIGEIFSFATH